MNIAIASGKGGTGKTTVSTNLALLLAESGKTVRYLDCDVEEPNGHLFLKPTIQHTLAASIDIPFIDETLCSACGACVRFCEYKALIRIGKQVMLFDELCHGCGGCKLLCPGGAISEKPKEIGFVESGVSGSIGFVHGRLNIGQAMSPPLIRRVLKQATPPAINIIDAPPGTSCPVIASVRKADFVVLVTEPTPFGLNDLGLALDMIQELGIAHGVVINRWEQGTIDADIFCEARKATILARIPDDRRIAKSYSRGEMILSTVPGIREHFTHLWQSIEKQVRS